MSDPDAQSDLNDNDMAMDVDETAIGLDSAEVASLTEEDVDPQHKMPLANDFDAMKDFSLPPLIEEPKILEDAIDTWTVESWRSLSKKEHGPVFRAGGFPWRILLFPHGNNVDQTSIYLEHGFEPSGIPENWSCCVQFSLVLWNPKDPSLFTHHSAHHRFTKEESDWGFTRFLELRKMFNVPWEGGSASRPICENETANITAYVRIVEDETGVLWHNFNNYDSKKETGYVGLKNQGATCYLNSLLQSLYFTNAFRKGIYEIPTEQDTDVLANSAYTLQRLFYQLQTSEVAVGTSELTKSFGWEARHVFEQQDVQELSRKLMERMEEKMKGTKAEALLPQMFSGKIKTYISCINVDYESSRVEDFWDIQLNVSGNKNLHDSFLDYIQVEKMEGENQYFAGEQHKLQDANKGVIFLGFPEVLHLQLKRFEYDIMRDSMTKINARYEFPDVFDAAPYLAADTDRSESWEYVLHGVLVHNGDLNAGHYYAFLKPEKTGWFYRYDDDKVNKATMREVLEENYGGEFKTPKGHPLSPMPKKTTVMRQNSAYMLVYIRRTRLDKILCPVTKDDIPVHVHQNYEDEEVQKEARRKEREEAHLYSTVKAVTDDSFKHHSGTDLGLDVAADDPAAPRSYKVLRTTTVQEFIPKVAADFGCDPKRVRLWLMVNRQNRTVRPDSPLTDPTQTLEDAQQRLTSSRAAPIRVWVEVAEQVNADGEAVWPVNQAQINNMVVKNDLVLLFLKYFDVDEQKLCGIGHVYISNQKKVEDIIPLILKKMGWLDKILDDEKILLWEEIRPTMVEPLKLKLTLKAAELQHGDIICFQRHKEEPAEKPILERRPGLSDIPPKSSSLSLNTTASSVKQHPDWYEKATDYYDYLANRAVIKFLPHPSRCDSTLYPDFELTLNTRISYQSLAERIGEHLGGIAPTHLRFWTVNHATGNPKVSVKRPPLGPPLLVSILTPAGQNLGATPKMDDALYFEVLEMSLEELDANQCIKLTWLSDGITKETPLEFFVANNGTVEDLIKALVKKAGIPGESQDGRIRIYEVSGNKVYRVLSRSHSVMNLQSYSQLYAERIPQDDLDTPDSQFVNAFHFNGEPSRVHGIPFRFRVIEDEEFADTKKRLEKRTGLKGKMFEVIKFAVVRRAYFSKPQYLNDSDRLWNLTGAGDDEFLGLDHPDRSRSVRNGAGDLFLR